MPTATAEKIKNVSRRVLVPRDEYRKFLCWKRVIKVRTDERWFWTKEWQEKEAEADSAIRKGSVSDIFSRHADLLTALKRNMRNGQ